MDRYELETRLDALLRLHDRKVCKEIDAGACQTSYDYRKRDLAIQAYEDGYDAFMRDVAAALDDK